MKLTAIKQINQLTKQTCMAYRRTTTLLLAMCFLGQINHALQGDFFSRNY